jgi:outer membrane receptor protein involved in Fe transport
MRILASRFSLSASVFALGAAFGSPAFAQTEGQQQQAQQQNTAVDCSTITDPAEHQKCVATQGQTAPATAGAPPEGAIVVTGSRIAKPNFDTVQPSTVLNSQAIEQRGFVNAADALNELPQFGIPGSSPVGAAQGGSFGTGQSFVNFLGLGSQRTLVLVNGRRFISSNTAALFGPTSPGEQVDLGLINTKLIDRIETIAIGGAPIYGSDAIAGTINVILKKDYEGVDLDAQDGISQQGDAHNWRVRGLAGKNLMDGRANVTISAEYNRSHGFNYTDRSVLRNANFYDTCNPGSQFTECLYPNGPSINAVTPGGVPMVFDIFGLSPLQFEQLFGFPPGTGSIPGFTFGVQDSNGNNLIFDPSGNFIPADYGVNPGGPDNFDIFASGGNGFHYIRDTSQALSDIERYNANLIGHFDITDNIRLFAEGWYSHSKGTNLRTQPEYNTAIFAGAGQPAGNIILSVNNPFLSAAQRQLIIDAINNNFSDQNLFGVPQDYFYLNRANIDLASGRATSIDNIYRVVGGLDGHFDALAGRWNWEVVANRGVAKSKGHFTVINLQNFSNAVGMVTADNPGGVPCLAGLANSPFPTLNSTCQPINLFGVNRNSQAAMDYVLSAADRRATNKQFVATADLNGPIFKLPGGDLSIAVGVEHRAESVDDDPGAVFHQPDADPLVDENGDGDPTNDLTSPTQFVPIIPIKGKFHTNEIFGELNADIIGPSNDIPAIYRLDAQAAARYVKHSVAGGDVTWTVGGRYAPVRDVAFRGNFTHAIRSPSIQEAFIPTSTFFSFATDPCDATQLNNGPDPTTRQANCAAEGIPTNFHSSTDDASFLQSTGGNPDLKNEKSNAYSIGAVITPRFIPRLNVSVDYISVKLRNAISAFSATQVLNSCYDAPNPASNPFCDLITRNPPGPAPTGSQVTFVKTSFFNADQLRYRGIVAALDWKVNTPFLGRSSTLGFSGSYQHLLELTTRAFGDQAPTNNDGTLGYPKDSFTVTANYLNGPLTLFTNVNYTGPVTQGVDEADNFREHQKLSAFTYVNSGFRIDVAGGRFRFFGDIDNVFNAKPPFPVPAFGGAVTYFPGVLGRYFRFGAGVHF